MFSNMVSLSGWRRQGLNEAIDHASVTARCQHHSEKRLEGWGVGGKVNRCNITILKDLDVHVRGMGGKPIELILLILMCYVKHT